MDLKKSFDEGICSKCGATMVVIPVTDAGPAYVREDPDFWTAKRCEACGFSVVHDERPPHVRAAYDQAIAMFSLAVDATPLITGEEELNFREYVRTSSKADPYRAVELLCDLTRRHPSGTLTAALNQLLTAILLESETYVASFYLREARSVPSGYAERHAVAYRAARTNILCSSYENAAEDLRAIVPVEVSLMGGSTNVERAIQALECAAKLVEDKEANAAHKQTTGPVIDSHRPTNVLVEPSGADWRIVGFDENKWLRRDEVRRADVERLQAELTAAQVYAARLREDLLEAKDELNDLVVQFNEVRRERDQLQSECSLLKDSQKELRVEVDLLKSALTERHKAYDALDAENQVLRAAHRKMVDEVEALKLGLSEGQRILEATREQMNADYEAIQVAYSKKVDEESRAAVPREKEVPCVRVRLPKLGDVWEQVYYRCERFTERDGFLLLGEPGDRVAIFTPGSWVFVGKETKTIKEDE